MARNFAQASSHAIRCSAGALSGWNAGNTTIVALIRRDAGTTPQTIVRCYTSGGVSVGGLRIDDSGFQGTGYVSFIGGSSATNAAGLSMAPGVGWVLVAGSKVAGTTPPRLHAYRYSTGAWTHGNGAFSVPDSTSPLGASGTIRIGERSGDQYFDGDVAALAIMPRVLTDAEIEALPYSLAQWVAARPSAMWLFDQAAITTPVLDLTGGGANQTAIVGTAVSTLSVPTWTYGHPILTATREAAGGGTVHDADVALTSAASLTGTPAADRAATAALTATATLTAAGARTLDASAPLTATANLNPTPARTADTDTALTATAALPAVGAVTAESTAALTGTAALSTAGSRSTSTTALLAGTASALAGGAVNATAGASLAAASVLTAGAAVAGQDSVSPLTATAGLAAATSTVRPAGAGSNASAALTAAPTVNRATTAHLDVVAGLSAAAAVTRSATATLGAVGSLAGVAGGRARPGILTATTSRPKLTASTSRPKLTASTRRGA